MKVVVVGQIHNFLPQLGLGWTESSAVVNVSQIDDDRQLSHFQRWLDFYCSAVQRITVTIVSAHVSLREELRELLESDSYKNIECEIQAPKDLMPFEDTEPYEKHSARLLPPLANRARLIYPTIYSISNMDDGKASSFHFVPTINALATTLTHQTAVSVGVVAPAHAGVTAASAGQLSLFTFFSRTTTPMGKRRLPAFLTHPLIDPEAIGFRQSFIKSMLNNRSVRLEIQNVCLSKMCDLDGFAYRVRNATKLPETTRKVLVLKLADISDTIDTVQSLRKVIESHKSDALTSVDGLQEWVIQPLEYLGSGIAKLRTLIHHVFDVDALRAAQRDKDTIILKPTLVDTLEETSKEVEECLLKMERHRAEVEREVSGGGRSAAQNKLRIIAFPNVGRVFRAPKSMQIPSKYTLIRVNKAETHFTTMKMNELNDRLMMSLEKVQSTEIAFIAKVLEVTATYLKSLYKLSDLLGMLDILCAFASGLSVIPDATRDWIEPQIVDTGCELSIEEGKHVLLELHSGIRGGSELVIPNDVRLCEGSEESRKVLLVTGPNMGGKSTYARQAVLIALMAQYGAMVPAKNVRLTPFTLAWTRIGADDAPGQGLSTFMTEAIETALMLRTLDSGCRINTDLKKQRALLVIDELGRGTSATDGIKFAEAVTNRIARQPGCLSIFATHFHILGTLTLPGLVPVCISRTTTPTSQSFKIKEGVESDSDGIALAKELGFPTELIDAAMELVRRRTQIAH